MNRIAFTSRRLRQTSILMAVCVVYQLGACPCGCLDHNYWWRMLAIADHDHHGSRGPAGTTQVAEDDHDCTGAPQRQFVNTARSPKHESDLIRVSQPACRCQDVSAAILVGDHTLDRGPPGIWAQTTCRISLQVFLL